MQLRIENVTVIDNQSMQQSGHDESRQMTTIAIKDGNEWFEDNGGRLSQQPLKLMYSAILYPPNKNAYLFS